MKFLFEFIPLLIFFGVLLRYDLYTATWVLMILMPLQCALYWLKYRKVEKMQLIATVLVIVLGSATLFFKDPLFIKWKPTVAYWLFAFLFLFTEYVSKKPLLRSLLGEKIMLPEKTWRLLNLSWVSFFFLLGCLNLYFAYQFDVITWAKFKVFGSLGLTFVFVIAQGIFISKHLKNGES